MAEHGRQPKGMDRNNKPKNPAKNQDKNLTNNIGGERKRLSALAMQQQKAAALSIKKASGRPTDEENSKFKEAWVSKALEILRQDRKNWEDASLKPTDINEDGTGATPLGQRFYALAFQVLRDAKPKGTTALISKDVMPSLVEQFCATFKKKPAIKPKASKPTIGAFEDLNHGLAPAPA